MLLKFTSTPSVSRRAQASRAHGPGCACCRRAVRVSANAANAAPAAVPSSVGKDGLVRIVDEEKVRVLGGELGVGGRVSAG
jgi:hypothetical protein